MLLLLFAFKAEMEPMRQRLAAARPLKGGLNGVSGRLGDVEISMLTTGIGIKRARAAAQSAFARLPETQLAMAAGVAGALSSSLRVGDVVIASHLLMRAHEGAGDERVHQVSPRSVAAIEGALAGAGISHFSGGILTVSRALSRRAEKVAARDGSGAVAVDMESAAIAMEAAQRGIQFACLRTILDTVEHELAGAQLADENGRVRPAAAALALLRDPRLALSGMRLMRNLRRSTAMLARALEAVARAQTRLLIKD